MTVEISVTASLSDGITADATLGTIKEVAVGPDIYDGEYTITPTEEDIVLPTADKLLEQDLTIEGTAIDWDFILYPIEGDENYIFNAKHVDCVEGSTIIIEWVGLGRVLSVYGKGETIDDTYFPRIRTYHNSDVYTANNEYWSNVVQTVTISDIPYTSSGNAKLVFAGGEWIANVSHSTNSGSQFRGEYMKVKIIPPTSD